MAPKDPDLQAIEAKLDVALAFDHRLDLIEFKLNAILAILLAKFPGVAVDLSIVLGPPSPPKPVKGSNDMASKKATGPGVKCPCLAPKGGKKAVMPDVTLTDPAPKSITLQPLDAAGNPVTLTPADTVTGTLTGTGTGLTVGPGADSLNYVGTIPANTPLGSTADLAATLKGTIQGAAADLTASVHVIVNIPPSPVAVDLAIVFG